MHYEYWDTDTAGSYTIPFPGNPWPVTVPYEYPMTTTITWPQLTEDDVRRIIREEFARLMSEWEREDEIILSDYELAYDTV